MISEKDMIDADYDDLSEADIIVLLTVDVKKPTSKTRLQRLSLIVHEMYGKYYSYKISFFRGYSDEIDESAVNLKDKGILDENKSMYSLTEYGKKLRQFIVDEYENEDLIRRINNIKSATSLMHDKNIVGLTHHFYDDAHNHVIAESVKKLNDVSSYDGIPLTGYKKTDFELKLLSGIPIIEGKQ